ncbi:hypothetical protein [uncultured Mitsuokella sp.]|uniref:hypothetical protein n=1 Tax=uncultured Mitsuokella sp. TaxID=453120 RepID=UPI0025FEC5F6|nr:hypothetical protein [uncultured Mitsuokella sp.]
MEEDIEQIVLLCLLPKPQGTVVDVMIMVIKNHLAEKSCIEHHSINCNGKLPDRIANGKIGWQKRSRYADKNNQQQENIGIKVHPPPEAVTEAGEPFSPLSKGIFLWTINFYKYQSEQRTQHRRQNCDLQILLYAIKK